MSFDPISAIFDLGKTAIEKIWPDANKRAEEMRKLEELRQTGNLADLKAHVDIVMGQLKINAVEAAHPNIFVSGWRPAIGWTGALALIWSCIIHPLLTWVWAFADMTGPTPPMIETGVIVGMVSAMLGVGTMRSHDKRHGVDTKRHS